MNIVRLIVEIATDTWESLDIQGTEAILSNFAINNLQQVSTRQGIYSNVFELPITARNSRILSVVQNINSFSNVPYRQCRCRIEVNGVPEVLGTLEVKQVKTTISAEVTGGNYEFYTQIQDKSIRLLGLSPYSHVWDYATVLASQGHTWEDGYTYPMVDYGKLAERSFASGITFDELYPAVFVRVLLQKMVEQAGFTASGSFMDNDQLKRQVLTIDKPFQYDEAFVKARSSRAGNIDSYHQEGSAGTLGDDDVFLNLPYNNDSQKPFYDGDKDNFNVTDHSYTADQLMYVEVKITQLVEVQRSLAGGAKGIVSLLLNGVSINSKETEFPASPTVYQKNYCNFSLVGLLLQPGDILTSQLHIRKYTTLGSYDWRLTMDSGDYFQVTMLNIFPPGETIILRDWLPNISQTDFLLTLVNQYNLLISTDIDTSTVSFEKFNKVTDSLGVAVDWSQKIDFSEAPELTFLNSNYGQKSFFRYVEDSSDPVLDNYRQHNAIPYGDASMSIPNQNLKNEVTVFESVFAATTTRNTFIASLTLPYIPIFETSDNTAFSVWNSADVYNITPVQDYVIHRGRYFRALINGVNASKPPLVEGTDDLNFGEWVEGTLVQFVERAVFSSQQPAPRMLLMDYNDTAFVNLLTDDLLTQVPYINNASFIPLEFGKLIPQNYAGFELALQQAKYLRCLIKLNTIDITTLDFTKPVWIASTHPLYGGMLNAYFYLSLIEQFRHGSADSCWVELLRIDAVNLEATVITTDGYYLLLEGFGYVLQEDTGRIIPEFEPG
jgi:hypothetical protein